MTNNEIQALLEEMTFQEKIGQLIQLPGNFYDLNGEITGPMNELDITEEIIHNAGSTLGFTGASNVVEVQKRHLKNSRLKIPLLFMADVVHGCETIFPIPLAMGCAFNPEAAYVSADVAATEAYVSGCHVTFAPMVDLVRDPRWGRVIESNGEDPYLNKLYASAQVEGFQKDLKEFSVASCVKHFAAYGAPEGGREYNTVDISKVSLYNEYLPAYKAAIDAGVKLVMTSFNVLDFVPASANSWLMRNVLRDEFGFDGVLISDWGAVEEVINHGVAADKKEAALKCLVAGVDIEMSTSCYVNNLEALVNENKVDSKLIDEAVLRILTLKNDLGLFEDPFRGCTTALEKEFTMCEDHLEKAYQVASESMVLLKNDQVLPLKNDAKVCYIGPQLIETKLLGAWSWKGRFEDVVTIKDGILKHQPEALFYENMNIEYCSEEQMVEALEHARGQDYVVLALGEPMSQGGEAASRSSISLYDWQIKFVELAKARNFKVIVTLNNSRPLDLTPIIDHCDAILECWYLGTRSGDVIADALFGKINPSGKLAMTFPRNLGQVPIYYNCLNTGRPYYGEAGYFSRYLDVDNSPLYAFGYGLTYSNFKIKNILLDRQVMTEDQVVKIVVDVENMSNVDGKEVIQVYLRDLSADVSRPLKELKRFKKEVIEAHTTKRFEFELSVEDFKYYNHNLEYKADLGMFMIYVGNSSDNCQEFTLELK